MLAFVQYFPLTSVVIPYGFVRTRTLYTEQSEHRKSIDCEIITCLHISFECELPELVSPCLYELFKNLIQLNEVKVKMLGP